MHDITVVVNAIPPSNNDYLGNSHSFVEYHQKKTEWHWLVKAAIKKRPEKPIDRATVTITYFFPDRRRRDPDNYSGKFILDALVREGLIVDDSFSAIRLVLCADVDKKNPRTEIHIEERTA